METMRTSCSGAREQEIVCAMCLPEANRAIAVRLRIPKSAFVFGGLVWHQSLSFESIRCDEKLHATQQLNTHLDDDEVVWNSHGAVRRRRN